MYLKTVFPASILLISKTSLIIPNKSCDDVSILSAYSVTFALSPASCLIFGGTEIKGSYTDNAFTATTTGDIAEGTSYEVGYIVTKTSGVNKLSFNNTKLPKAYYICMNTVDKDENEVLTPFKIIAHKAQPQRNFELSQSSEGDAMSVTLTFDLLQSEDKQFVDMIEIEDEE